MSVTFSAAPKSSGSSTLIRLPLASLLSIDDRVAVYESDCPPYIGGEPIVVLELIRYW